ncbi:7765_t:CDS:2, partial [Dentiscutata heterogama]
RLRSDASFDSPTPTYDSNTHEEIDELYLETSQIRNYEHTITILQQQLQEQENRKLTMITEFQRNFENQDNDKVDRNEELVKHWDSRYSNQDKRIQ